VGDADLIGGAVCRGAAGSRRADPDLDDHA
jgi:hypothetical protein